jgi:hypothetical protein
LAHTLLTKAFSGRGLFGRGLVFFNPYKRVFIGLYSLSNHILV